MNGAPHDTTPQPQTIESIVDRAKMRAEIEALRREMTAHLSADEELHREILSKLDRMLQMRTQIRTLVAVGVFAVGGLLVAGQWMISHAVTDALIQHGIVKVERLPS